MNIDQQLEANQNRRIKAQNRFLSRIEKREEEAEKMIGELSNGKFYIWPIDGKYREGTQCDLIRYLIRNNYA